MIRQFIFAFICCLTLFACKNETASGTDASSTATTPVATESSTKASTETKPEEASTMAKTTGSDTNLIPGQEKVSSRIRSTIGGVMIKSADLNDGTLRIEYYKNADDFKASKPNPKMNDTFFKSYWSSVSRAEKVMALVPSQMLNDFPDIKNVDITIHTGEKTLTANLDRDKLAQFVGRTWKEIQTDWNNLYRFVVVNDKKKRKAFFEKYVSIN